MKPNYFCFLLRMWQVGDQDAVVRVLLEDPSSREVMGFAGVQDLCAYLEEILRQSPAIPVPATDLASDPRE